MAERTEYELVLRVVIDAPQQSLPVSAIRERIAKGFMWPNHLKNANEKHIIQYAEVEVQGQPLPIPPLPDLQ